MSAIYICDMAVIITGDVGRVKKAQAHPPKKTQLGQWSKFIYS